MMSVVNTNDDDLELSPVNLGFDSRFLKSFSREPTKEMESTQHCMGTGQNIIGYRSSMGDGIRVTTKW